MSLLVNRRRGVGKSSLYDAEIEYLQSSGTQWIDVSVLANKSSKVEVKCKWTPVNAQRILSTRTASWTNQFEILGGTSNKIIFRFGSGTVKQREYTLTNTSNWHVMYMDATKATVDGQNSTGSYGDINISNTYSVVLFAGGGDIRGGSRSSLPIVYVKFYDNDDLVRDLIPVRKGNIGYMYDKVSSQLFENSGTGNFILGPDK